MRPVHVFVSAKTTPDGGIQCPDYEDPEYQDDLGRAFQAMGVPWTWVPVTLLDIHMRVEAARKEGATVLNLCDGDDAQGLPGVQVIEALDGSGVAYTGSDRFFYGITTSRRAMKLRFRAGAVPQADWWCVATPGADLSELRYPVILKPDVSGGSYGIETSSVVRNLLEARRQLDRLFSGALHGRDFRHDGVIAEEFVDGSEFSVLVVGDWNDPGGLEVYPPVERFFADGWPRILTYEINWERYEGDRPPISDKPGFWHGKVESAPVQDLVDLARRAYVAVGGIGYGRVDLRRCRTSGRIVVLEVNANCGLSSDPHSSTVGAILSIHASSFSDLVGRILSGAEARRRVRAVHALVPALDRDDGICWGYGEPSFTEAFEAAIRRCGMDIHWHRIWIGSGIQDAMADVGTGDVVFNICDGDDRTYPGASVVDGLEARGLVFTGAKSAFYRLSTSKTSMKEVFARHLVDTATWAKFEGDEERFFREIEERVGFPCLFKPDESAGSFGIRQNSRVADPSELEPRFAQLRSSPHEDLSLACGWFAEAFVSGREFTVLISGDSDAPESILVQTPLEYGFSESLPPEERFLFYARRYETDAPADTPDRYRYGRPEAGLDELLREVAKRAFIAMRGCGYARVDMRQDARTKTVHVLEVNANCGLGCDPEISTMGAILASDLESYPAFLNRVVGIARLPGAM